MAKLNYLKNSVVISILISIIMPFIGIIIGLAIGLVIRLDEGIISVLIGGPIFLEISLLTLSVSSLIPRFILFGLFGFGNYYIYKNFFYKMKYPKIYFIISSILFYYIAVFFIYSYISHFLFGGPSFPIR